MLEYLLSLNRDDSTFIGRRWYVQCFPFYRLEKEKAIFFDIKFHDSYLMKCLHNNISQNDTIWWHLYLPHLVSTVKTTSNQCYTWYVTFSF